MLQSYKCYKATVETREHIIALSEDFQEADAKNIYIYVLETHQPDSKTKLTELIHALKLLAREKKF